MNQVAKLRATAATALRFGVAGIANTLATAVLLSILARFINPAVAYALVFAAGIALSTFLAGSFVFRTRLTPRRVAAYVAMYITVFLIGLLALSAAISWGMPRGASGLVALVTAPLTFIGARLIMARPAAADIQQDGTAVSAAESAIVTRPATVPSHGPRPIRWWDPGEARAAFLVAALLAAAYVAITAARGALGASRNDDWVYLRTAFDFAETGAFHADPWSLAMLIGLVLLAWPVILVLGPDVAALQIMIAGLAAIGLVACYLVIRTVLSRGWSAFAVGCLALGPIYGSVATTFMTDVPAFTFQMLAVLAGLVALRSERFALGWFGLSLLAGLAAFSVREYAAAATAAVAGAALLRAWNESRRAAALVLGLIVAWLIVAGALYSWRSGLVEAGGVVFHLTPTPWDKTMTRLAIFTLALFVVPLAPLVSLPGVARALWANKWLGAVVLLGALAIGYQFLTARREGGLVGNYVAPTGAYSVTVAGTPPTVIPAAAWSMLSILGLVGLLTLFVLIVLRVGGQVSSWIARESRPSMPTDWGRTLMLLYCVAAGGLLTAIKLFTTAPLFDRYLISLVPFTIALALRAAIDHGVIVRPSRVVGVAALGVFAVFGIGMVDNTATFDGLKWRLAQSVQELGYAPETIDGGYEWFGLHQPDDIDLHLSDVDGSFWLGLFNDPTVCVTSQYAGPPVLGESDVDPAIISERRARSLLGVEYHLVAVAGPHACPSPDLDGN